MNERILILGGGVIGLATAFELSRRNYEVTVVEKSSCGGQASGAAAGMLAPFSEIGEDPDDFFTFCRDSLLMFKNWQNEIKKVAETDFDFTESGSLHAVYHEADLLALETRQSWQKKFGSKAELITGKTLHAMEPHLSDSVIAALYSPEESHVFSPDYVKALKSACEKNGVTIEEKLSKVDVREWQDRLSLQSEDGRIFSGDKLIVCSGAWSNELEKIFGIRIPVFPIRGQICAYELGDEQVNHIIYTSQGYLVPKTNETLVNGASEDMAGFQTTVTEKGIARLTNWNKNVLPFLTSKAPFHTWAGLRPATQDGFPLIGKLETHSHIVFATGHYRNGILLSPMTAFAVADLLDGKNEYAPLASFKPERFSFI
ncbi:glycine oxidase ThiO [Alteribacter populi]|uniref:glycine oxidase ThiO n=1 Tax=Alteribacter populi TaxID=2011011 RepID=UPI000BBB2318|nr:glycine oxidase ThiO [Alteribacter populi]